MASHRMETTAQSETVRNPETNLLADERLQRQLGRKTLEGLTLASPVETHPYAELETSLNHFIIGQPDAVRCTINALNRDELRNPNRPKAVLMYLGPSGVGKTQTAEELAHYFNPDDDSAFLRLDCSEYAMPHTTATLTGAPPGYVGREQIPKFHPSLIEKDNMVVVFDEIEKGSDELRTLMLHIMEKGEVTINTTGEKTSFRNAILILTSNLGSTEMMKLLESRPVGFQLASADKAPITKRNIGKATDAALKLFFKPEFLNRIDRRVVFNPLDDEQLTQALDVHVERANERYKDKGAMLEMSPDLKERIITSAEERRELGVRPVLRAYERMVESNLTQHLAAGSIPRGSNVYAVLSEQDADQGYEYGEDVKFYFERNPSLMPKRKTKEVVLVRSEAESEEVSEAA